ncbi:regulator of chromosome condensation 1/beta-lactamase-inhibitor protein II [Phascolomyces articulosus]|uniref:Regulator of chromosome condensation 1/beta-lactamase-inhibitor protein II n=1 Tax=Phascolomyces articulosus TaxID=60185 RepID=A0AAD5KU80_9FUNG|nr:regulator of chromosome condensation 1/beta-lactamase-inhibitor protein II [Phascolomyces articulosus]
MVIDQLPIDILLDHIIPRLDVASLCQVSYTCHLFYRLCNDEFIWQYRVSADFALPMNTDRLKNGWKKLYIQLDRAQTYTWGENSDKRLGFSDHDNVERDTFMRQITTPRELRALRGKGIVDIVAGGWSFHALDRRGHVWMWGWMQPKHPFADSMTSQALVKKPTRVQLPPNVHIISIASGRCHAIALDTAGRVWHWANPWQTRQVLVPRASTKKFIQITAHWNSSAILSSTGELFLVPFPCASHEQTILDDPPVTHPSSPFIQIAGTEKCTIALTQSGRVFKFRTERRDDFVTTPEKYTTELVHFNISPLNNNLTTTTNRKSNRPGVFLSAQFRHFAICCQGKVLIGKQDGDDQHLPQILDAMNHEICKVTFGDYHFGALTTQGRLLTWGRFSSGALGLGYAYSNINQTMPQLVETLNNMFIFAIGFGGVHSGCLAIPRSTLIQQQHV